MLGGLDLTWIRVITIYLKRAVLQLIMSPNETGNALGKSYRGVMKKEDKP
jgi:hypothetical protein